jgi:membrane associated rhomboid family serine protease
MVSRYSNADVQFVLPRPGKGLKAVLIGLFAVWLAFAIGINWAGVSPELFLLLCGNNERVMQGEVWRLFTAPLMHQPSGDIGHIVGALVGLYFLSPSLEEDWGTARFLRFLAVSSVLAYALQMLVAVALPSGLAAKLVPVYWFGSTPAMSAIAIAFALSFKGRVVRLFFVLPVSSRGLIVFVVGVAVLLLIAGALGPAGLVAPFFGMLFGWLLGGGTPSPLRRFYLRYRLAQLDIEARRARAGRRERAERSGFRVISGGKTNEPPESNSSNGKDGPDGSGRTLN